MDNHEESGRNAAILLHPLSVKPKTISAGELLMGGWGISAAVFFVLSLFSGDSLSISTIFFSFMPVAISFWSSRIMIKQDRRDAFIDAYQFPAAVKNRVGKHYPHLSDDQLSLVMQGLKQYFKLFSMAGNGTISMPSRVVDVAWHEFILITQAYKEFCQQGIDRFIHHTPAEEMTSATELEEGMKKAWFLACKWEGIDQQSPSRLPFLFAIDVALDIPDGFNHSLDNNYATNSSTGCGGCGCGGC